VDILRPLGLKSPLSGVMIDGVVEPDPSPLDVSSLFGIATIVGDWDQESKRFVQLPAAQRISADAYVWLVFVYYER